MFRPRLYAGLGLALLACSEHGAVPLDAAISVTDLEAGDYAEPRAESGGGIEPLQQSDASGVDAFISMLDDAGPVAGDAAHEAGRTALILPDRWLELAASEDPFEDRPPLVTCPHFAVAAETLGGEGALSVDTGSCDYLTVSQATLSAVEAGETLHVRLWHFELSAAAPAEAHAAVFVDGLHVLDERVPIPQAGGLIRKQLVLTRAIPAGTPVYFHLHNHGTNYWALVELSAGP